MFGHHRNSVLFFKIAETYFPSALIGLLGFFMPIFNCHVDALLFAALPLFFFVIAFLAVRKIKNANKKIEK